MTAIVGVLNSQGIAIAADSAVTVTGNNGKKVYNRSNKLFTLSKYHPVGIAIYSSANFMGIPLETLIKMYRAKLGDSSFPTLEEYKLDFIDFLKLNITKISPKFKSNSFYTFCSETYIRLKDTLIERLDHIQPDIALLVGPPLTAFVDAEIDNLIEEAKILPDRYDKAAYINKTFQEFQDFYVNELQDIIDYIIEEVQKFHLTFGLNANHITEIHNLLFSLINIEVLFENHSGIIFVGFGEDEIYPSSQYILVGSVLCDELRFRVATPVDIIPGELDSNILPYVQGDVATTVLTGVDPIYKNEVMNSIDSSFGTISEEIVDRINDPAITDPIEQIISDTRDKLKKDLNDYQFRSITAPLLGILTHMGKEDMAELAESLVNITSLKRKFSSLDSADESVGGPIDVAVITKGDGFIWMKRKNYFDISDNKGFYEKYYK